MKLASVRDRYKMRGRWSTSDLGISATNGDPHFSKVKLLLNMGGADASTTFTDSAGTPHTMTAHGNAQIDTSQGYNAALFDGSGDYVDTPYVKADFDWWTTDFVLEAWIKASAWTNWSYVDGVDTPALIGCADPASTTNYWSFGPNASGSLMFYYYNGSAQRKIGGTVSTDSDVHVALLYDSTNGHFYFARGGVVTDQGAVSGTPQSSATSPVKLTLGMINNRSISDYVKAVRLTKGSGLRYSTAGFTPDSAPFLTS